MNETKRPDTGFARGALCEQAQADGVPCPDLGRDCETCERALTQLRREHEDLPRDENEPES